MKRWHLDSFANAQWYEQGVWPLVGAILILLVTNGVSLWSIYLQANKNLKNQLRLNKIDFVSQQLSEFYNPMYSLILSNGHIFKHFGPSTFPDDEIFRQSAGENWYMLKTKRKGHPFRL